MWNEIHADLTIGDLDSLMVVYDESYLLRQGSIETPRLTSTVRCGSGPDYLLDD